MAEEKLFGKYNEFIIVLLGFLLTGVIGTYISQTYTMKNAELTAANKIFSEYSQLIGDRYFTMNQVMIAIKNDYSDADIKSRWNAYRSELQKWNTARSYNREMIKLYFGQPLWNTERDIHYFFRAWGQSLESANKDKLVVDFECLEGKIDRFLVIIHSFNFSFGKAIQKGEIGSNKDQSMVDKNPRPPTPCLIKT
tara:strand:+ start:3060 stop:3644 length:585 start_codon:yes stop_codon:yes gene_type:complete